MKLWVVTCLSAMLMGFQGIETPAAENGDSKPEIMVLGTFHFTGGGYDVVNPEVDNYLSPQRQSEIVEVVDRLTAFSPTKIAIEALPEEEDTFNQMYADYRNGNRALGVGERQQIGLRLAAQLGLPKVYAVDFKNGGMNINGLFELGNQTGQGEVLEYLLGLRSRMTEQDKRMNAADVTIRERLLHENSKEVAKAHNVYLTMAQIGDADNHLGAEEMGNWWSRNLHIFANISHIAEPGDRILVIYGTGHKFLLDQFINDSHEFRLVDPQDFLN